MMTKLDELIAEHFEVFPSDFLFWLEDNKHVYALFRTLANQLWMRGRKYYSAYTIREKMRFDHDISEVNSTFKINNIHTAYMSRLYVLEHPLRVGLFRFRKTPKVDVNFMEYMKANFPEVAALYADQE